MFHGPSTIRPFFLPGVLALACWLGANRGVLAERPELLAHWPLRETARDAAAGGHHGTPRHVTWTGAATDSHDWPAAAFDGRRGYVEVPHDPSFALGTEPFTIACWVHTEEVLDDVLGDLVSKYDPDRRAGFQLSIQNYSGVTASQPNHRHVHFGIDSGDEPGEWTDHGRLGNAVLIYGMAVHDGQLFVGTCEAGASQAGRVFRYDGERWVDCGSPDRCNAVSSLAVYRGKLYVGVSKYRLAGSSLTESQNPALGGKIYRYDGDDRWTWCGTLPEVEAINGMAVFRDRLYASSMYAPAGFFRYEGGSRWTSCGTPGGKRVEALAVHNGFLYATGYDEGAVYRYDGREWEDLGRIEGARQTYGFATYRGDLYVSEWPNARVFRLAESGWVPAGRLGDEKETMPLMVYNGKLYAGTLPSAEVYRFDPPRWTRIARLDFTPDVRYRRVWTMAVFQGRLFAGTLPSGRVHSVEIGRNVTYDQVLPAGWVHLTAVRDADHLRLHANGKLVARSARFDSSQLDLSNEQPLWIGRGQHDYFNGRLSDVRIYRGAMSPDEVARLAGQRPTSP